MGDIWIINHLLSGMHIQGGLGRGETDASLCSNCSLSFLVVSSSPFLICSASLPFSRSASRWEEERWRIDEQSDKKGSTGWILLWSEKTPIKIQIHHAYPFISSFPGKWMEGEWRQTRTDHERPFPPVMLQPFTLSFVLQSSRQRGTSEWRDWSEHDSERLDWWRFLAVQFSPSFPFPSRPERDQSNNAKWRFPEIGATPSDHPL